MAGAGHLHHRLHPGLETLDWLLERHPPEAFDRATAEGKWSARENLAHLARYHVLFLERLERLLLEESPAFPRYRAEEDPEWPEWRSRPLDELARRFRRHRQDLLDRLDWLTPEQLARTGRHPAFGLLDVPSWIEFFVMHEGHHFYLMMLRLNT